MHSGLYRPSVVNLACVLSLVMAVQAQAPQASNSLKAKDSGGNATITGTSRSINATVPENYIIGPSDVLAITVWKESEFSKTMPVRPDGKISLPLIGEMQASGLTTAQLKQLVGQKLRDYIDDPEVNIVVAEIKSRSFNIMGKVVKPGSYDLARPLTVLDAIALAGGFQDFAKVTKVYVLRRMVDGSQQMLPFNYKMVIKGKNLQENTQIQPGDTVVIP
jgi:polysaccharide biosynthesis/export protein